MVHERLNAAKVLRAIIVQVFSQWSQHLAPKRFMKQRRVGVWMIGALGGVGSSVALGVAALQAGCVMPTGLVTALPLFDRLDLDNPGQLVVGGCDVRGGDLATAASAVGGGSPAYSTGLLDACRDRLLEMSAEVRPGVGVAGDALVARLSDRGDLPHFSSPSELVNHVQRELRTFAQRNELDQVVVVNLASTEPPAAARPEWVRLEELRPAASRDFGVLPTSGWYAYAAIDAGCPYVNFTPSLGADVPALAELAKLRGVPIAGQDGKTGETLVKSALARMFALRNLRVLSWVGHNILGNRDGRVLDDPANRASKLRTKDRVVADVLGYAPESRTSIEYVEAVDDWKTAWDHVLFQGFLGVRMSMQFTWQGCDSALAAPLVIDLARLVALAQRRGEAGVARHLACFFKNPMGVTEHDFSRQFQLLDGYVRDAETDGHATRI